jgi:hypothetical protein
MQDGDAKLSKRQQDEIALEVAALHALQPMRSASHHEPDAQLRVRRADRPENVYEVLPYFRRLHRWLHVSDPAQLHGKQKTINLRRMEAEFRAAGAAGAAAGADEDSDGPNPPAGSRRSRRGGTAEDPRRRREIAAAKQARDAAKQKQRAAGSRQQGRGAGDGAAAAGGVSTPVARRRRIQEMSSKPLWQHTPSWEGWLPPIRQTYGLRVKYPSLRPPSHWRTKAPIVIRQGVIGAMQVQSRIHLILSADGTVLTQLWEYEGSLLFSAILALANRGQTIVVRNDIHCILPCPALPCPPLPSLFACSLGAAGSSRG